MQFDQEIDPVSRLVTIRVRGHASPANVAALARQLFADERIKADFSFLVVVEDGTSEASPVELRELAEVVKFAGQRFTGRKALVTAQTGRVTRARMLALTAATHDEIEAFTTESAARRWLLARRPC